ncbi:MAG: cytochrome c biogenesis protein CcsA, partial [Anaerolineae bacterium]|nr:cytochrome c biogenesis protein CcsA [Anaerolineae bacterium]
MFKSDRVAQILNLVTAGLLLVATAMVFFYAPTEVTMGAVQRVFYFHVAAAWVGLAAFMVTFVAGLVYLRTGKHLWDQIGHASVEIGLVFTVMGAASGSIWARPAWNTWWTWDPRLTTYTIMALIYVAYLMLRQGLDDPDRRAFCGHLRDCGVYQRADHVLLDPHLAHHPSGGGGRQRRRGPGHLPHDQPHAADDALLGLHLLGGVRVPVGEPGAAGGP